MLCKTWNSSIFDCKLTGHHQRIKSIEEIDDYHKKRNSKALKYVYLTINLWALLFLEFFASHSVCTTVARGTTRWVKFVDEIGSTVFYRNLFIVFATSRAITKADHPFNFTVFHCGMSTNQPAWPVCITSTVWHACCWHFWSRWSHKTIPSLFERTVTQVQVSCGSDLSVGFTQVFVMIARIGYKVKLQLWQDYSH